MDPPLLLWYRGDLSITNLPGFSVIGTREATPEGIVGGIYLAGEFAKRGFNIVSGLAIGCDTCGHKGALKVKGKTTAILANGLDNDSIYPPENKYLAEEIVQNGGLLISEYRIGTIANLTEYLKSSMRLMFNYICQIGLLTQLIDSRYKTLV